MEGRNFLSQRRRGGVRGGRVVVGDGISGVVGEPGGGKSQGYLMRFLTLDGRVDCLCFWCRRRRRKRARQAIRRKPRAELRAMATLVPVASGISGYGTLDESEERGSVSAAAGTPVLAVGFVGAPLCVARIVLSQVEVCAGSAPAAADEVCAGRWRLAHSPTEPSSTVFPSVLHS
jgi:hypothetical protein